MTTAAEQALDAVIIGAGPAGCSAASWLAQLGYQAVLLERAAIACPHLEALDFMQDWVLGSPQTSPRQLGRNFARHLQSLPGVDLRLQSAPSALRREPSGLWQVSLADGTTWKTRTLVLATGLSPRRPAAYFDFPGATGRVFDSVQLTATRATLPAGDILVLGGGDNAVENALFLHEHGHRVTVCTRGSWRAQPALLGRMRATPGLVQREGQALPQLEAADSHGLSLRFPEGHLAWFEGIAVLFGFDPDASAFALVEAALRDAGLPPAARAHEHGHGLAESAAAGVFVAGDAAGNGHPCIHTALAEGVRVAKAVQSYRQERGRIGAGNSQR